MKLFFLISLFSLSSAALAIKFPSHFLPLTDSQRKSCEGKNKCFVTMVKTGEKYRVQFRTRLVNKNERRIDAVTIGPAASKKGETYVLPSPKALFGNEISPLFAADINGDGFNDVALQAGVSATKGMVYYYWVFNPKAKAFVFSNSMYPALRPGKDSKLISMTSTDKISLDKNYRIVDESTSAPTKTPASRGN